MQFTTSIVVAGLAALVSAQANPFTITTLDSGLTAGTPVDLTWTPTSSGTITLLLKQGLSTNLDTVSTIVANTANTGSFSWTPSTSLVQGSDYALEIVDDTNENSVNYSGEFTINSSNTVSASTQSSTATTSSSSSASSTSSASATSTSSASSSSTTTSSSSTSSTSSTTSTTTGSSTTSSHTSSITAAASSNSTTTLSTKTSSKISSATSSSATQSTTAIASNGGMRFKVGGSMLALVFAVMLAL